MSTQYIVGRKLEGTAGHVVVSADDALEAALKVKAESPQARITYVRRTNRRGDARHPAPAPAEARGESTRA